MSEIRKEIFSKRVTMKRKFWFLLTWLFLSLPLTLGPTWAGNPEVKFIDPETLRGKLGAADLVIIDVSTGSWSIDLKITGALLFSADEVSSWAPQLPKGKKIVLYCA
jgi:hypothetical protein